MEVLGIVQLSPTVSKGIFGGHRKHRDNQLWWENSSTSPLAEVAMCQGSKWEVWLWSLPQTAGIKDQTLKYQEPDGACWLLSVIPAGAESLCVCVGGGEPPGIRFRLGSKHGSCTLARERACASLCKQQVIPVGEAIPTLPEQGATSSPSSSSSVLVTAPQAEIYNTVTGGCSQVCTVLSISKEMSKSQNEKSFMFSTTKREFFQSAACLRVTKVHAEDWRGLLPMVLSLQSTANCHFQWENNLQNYISCYCTKEHVPCC